MNWNKEQQLLDLESGERLEATCKICRHTFSVDIDELLEREEMQHLYLDQLEKRTVCSARGCGGPVILAQLHQNEVEGFAGGLA